MLPYNVGMCLVERVRPRFVGILSWWLSAQGIVDAQYPPV
jgi:hypothetical protein